MCYNCDEKFAPGHKCKSQQLFTLEAEDETEDHVDDGILEEEDPLGISLHALSNLFITSNYAPTRLGQASVGFRVN